MSVFIRNPQVMRFAVIEMQAGDGAGALSFRINFHEGLLNITSAAFFLDQRGAGPLGRSMSSDGLTSRILILLNFLRSLLSAATIFPWSSLDVVSDWLAGGSSSRRRGAASAMNGYLRPRRGSLLSRRSFRCAQAAPDLLRPGVGGWQPHA